MWRPKLMSIPSAAEALPGRPEPLEVDPVHFVNGEHFVGDCPDNLRELIVGMGCFWGAERRFWQADGVVVTSVGYGAGHTPNPTYQEVCSGDTGHNELVRIWYDPQRTSLEVLLKIFWESHDPTQGMRQGNDVGTQYRSGIYLQDDGDIELARRSLLRYQQQLIAAGKTDQITTEVLQDIPYFLAETYHQQYLAKNPNGYCGLGGCNISYD